MRRKSKKNGPNRARQFRRGLARGFEALCERRVLASITGTVFDDVDQSRSLNNDEVGVEERLVFIDVNNNTLVDLGEPLQRTSDGGQFEFQDLAAGTHRLRIFKGSVLQQTTVPDNNDFLSVSLAEADSSANVSIGISDLDTNTGAPTSDDPVFTVPEDSTFTNINPGVFGISGNPGSAQDDDGDTFVAIQTGDAAVGTITISPNGTISYVPVDDFVGEDTATFVLHDGRSVSEEITARVVLTAVSDPPSDIEFVGNPLPENAEEGAEVGAFQVIDPDIGDVFDIFVEDQRFQFQNNLLILAPNVQLNFEDNPELRVAVRAVNKVDPNEVIEREVVIPLADADDPATDLIGPAEPVVNENAPGAVIGRVTVVDEDVNQQHQIAVDDQRFEVVNGDLKLVEGQSLNADEDDGTSIFLMLDSLSTEVIISVANVNDPPDSLSLDGSIPELTFGAIVGQVEISDPDPDDTHSYTVSDSRFEVDATGVMRLTDDSFVVYDDEPSITLTLTATDSGTPAASISDEITITVISIPSPWQNPLDSNDVNNDGEVSAVDALQIVNRLNATGPKSLKTPFDGSGFYDVNGDGLLTPLDALLVINELNTSVVSAEAGSGLGSSNDGDLSEGEGEQQPSPQQIADSDTSDDIGDLQADPSRSIRLSVASLDSVLEDEEDWTNPDLEQFLLS